MSDVIVSDVTQLSWSQLNHALLECTDATILQYWLEVTTATGLLTRTLRIYKRLSVVRRVDELKDLKRQVVAAQRGAAA